METKTPPPTQPPSICSHGISQTFSCNFAASQTTLKALFMSSVRGSLDPSNRSIDPDESPAVIVVRIAFHLVYKAFLTGDKSDIQPALTGLDSAQTLIDQQRSKYLNLIESSTEAIPLVGGLLSTLWSPIQAATNTVADLTGLRSDTTHYSERMVQTALAAEALTQLYRCALLFLSGKSIQGLQAAHSSYRDFLAISENTTSPYAKDVRNFGIGFFAVLLSYLPATYRAGFNMIALSTGTSRERGIEIMQQVATTLHKKTIVPILCILSLSVLDVLKASQEGAVLESVRITCLTNAKERLDVLKSSNNIIVDWFLGQILKRNGNYNASKSNLIAIMKNIGPHLEHRPFTLERSTHYNIHDESVIKSVYRVRFDLSTTLLMTRDWNKAVAVLEPLCTKGSGYVGRAMALMLRASTLSQIDGDSNDTAIKEAYQVMNELAKEDQGSKQGMGSMDNILMRKVTQDVLRIDKRLALYDLLYMWGHIGLSSKTYLTQINVTLEDAYPGILSRYENNPNDINSREEMIDYYFLHGVIAVTLFLSGDISDEVAETDLRKVLELSKGYAFKDPYHVPHALYELGMMYYRQEKKKQAKEVLVRAQKIPEGYLFDRALQFRINGPLDLLN